MSNDAERDHKPDDERPSPEELLDRYGLRDRDIAQGEAYPSLPSAGERPPRGRLRIYLAAAAGAGKTYAMLQEGHRRKGRGADVVIGYIEPHARPLTAAQIGDLPIVPRKKIEYRGVKLEEMDTDAIIARHPQVALVDELAHTNVPGSKHPKRYQDVEELLAAGINVVTTLNIQHLESLNDVVANITGVRVRETLPDQILDQADEVELIDISPYALRRRMRHGNIYPPERIEPALHNFFREGNLIALRELALRRVAEKTEEQLQEYMAGHHISKSWFANEHVLVGFDARPHTGQIIRDAWRLAHGLHADLIAVYVQPVGYRAWTGKLVNMLRHGIDAEREYKEMLRRIEEHAQLAEDLGAEVIRATGSDIARTLLDIARKHQVTQIVLGQPARSRWEEMLRGSIINRLLRMGAEMDIHIVPLLHDE
jgi:two-component system, OmpR family, sensor histidine kinase KdpD